MAGRSFVLSQRSVNRVTGRRCSEAGVFDQPVSLFVFYEARRLPCAIRLVIDLGLQTSLTHYKVPPDALESVAEGALGTQNQNYEVSRVVRLLETLYKDERVPQ